MLRESDVNGESALEAVARGDEARARGDLRQAEYFYLAAADGLETPDGELCLKLARCYEGIGSPDKAFRWLTGVTRSTAAFTSWMAAVRLLDQLKTAATPPARRRVKIALEGTYTTSQLGGMMRLAALQLGVDADLYEGDFGQYQQDILNAESSLYHYEPEVVVLAVDERAAQLRDFEDVPTDAVDAEVDRWARLWEVLNGQSSARIIQHNFAIRPDPSFGHLSLNVEGTRYAMLHELNRRLSLTAPAWVNIVDCDRIASSFGKDHWFDDRYWHIAKQAVALDALPLLARHTAAVLAASLGVSRKCLVFDLDNTIWGGVVGEDGLSGLDLGSTPRGEAYVALQEYILELKNRGIILAVVSKNNEADAREVFERHPDMRLGLDDIAIFLANWDDKPTNVRRVADELNLGLDTLVLLEDNPAEREIVRQTMPDVEVLVVPDDPVVSLRTLAGSLLFEPATFTAEDRNRADHYRARAQISMLEKATTSLDDFYRSLQMEALVAPFDELHLSRIVQLFAKTNQFNLTTRRHGAAEVQSFMEDPNHVHLYLKLRDRFTDHGLVALIVGKKVEDVLDIDSFLMSCRVIGRTIERELLKRLCESADRAGCSRLRGTYIPTAKNQVVATLYGDVGFCLVAENHGTTSWEYDLADRGPITSDFISSTLC